MQDYISPKLPAVLIDKKILSAPSIHMIAKKRFSFQPKMAGTLGEFMTAMAHIIVGIVALLQMPKIKSGMKLVRVIINEPISICCK